MKAPVPKKIAKSLIKHNDQRIDHYYWMNNREDPDVIHHLKQENQFCDDILKHTKPLQQKIYQEIVNRIKPNDDSTPYLYNNYYYQFKYTAEDNHPKYYRKQKEQKDWKLLVDAQHESESHKYYKLGALQASPDNKFIAYSEDTQGRRLYTIRIKELKHNQLLVDEIKNSTGGIAWADSQSFFYTKKDAKTLRSYQIWRHILGNDMDQLVYEEKDESFYTFAYRSKSGQFIIIGSHSTISSEYRLIPTNNPNQPPEIFQPREDHHEYEIFDGKTEFLIRTNWQATNFRVMSCSFNNTFKEDWIELLPASDDILYEDVEITRNRVAILSRSHAIPDITLYDRRFLQSVKLKFQEQARMLYLSNNLEYDNKKIRLVYCSLTTPYTTYDYDPQEKSFTQLKRQEVLGGYDSTDYESQRIYVKSHDHVEVPISIVYKKSLFKEGHNPCLLYGYGSYGHSIDPYFSIPRISLLDRGFVFAIAHIRGGQELGRTWYDHGKLLKKQNTFSDFIACGKGLIEQKYAAKDKLCGMGGSAGGLLIGTVMNQNPQLWKAMVAAVPFVDVVTTMLDESIPLTTGEYNEWGNPNNNTSYHYIKAYSPYDNVTSKAYPSLLVTTGYHDSQVQYWEPAKWVAKLREHNTSVNPIVFFTNMEAGHSGKAGRFEQYHETALEWAFLIDQTKST